jgi:1-deoxy-D-xylulose-5-phosphate synthase
LQRGFDQVIHDVCLMDLPVVIAMDRAGIVGEDGETHQGAYDISFLRLIPNMTLCAPRDERSFHQIVEFAATYEHPCAIRYPRGAFFEADLPESLPFEKGKAQLLLANDSDRLFIGYGNGVGRAAQTIALMEQKPSLLDLRFVKPLDDVMLRKMAALYKQWYVFSDSARLGGVGSALLEWLSEAKITDVSVVSFEYDDKFIKHGNARMVEESLGLLPEQLAAAINAE